MKSPSDLMSFSADDRSPGLSKISPVGEVKTRFTESIMKAVYFESSSGLVLSTKFPTNFWYGSKEIEMLLLNAYSSSSRRSRAYWTLQKAIAYIKGSEIDSFR